MCLPKWQMLIGLLMLFGYGEIFRGYLAKIAFEGEQEEGANTHWVHFCQDLYRIGHCADNHLPIVPPQKQEWREWIIKRVTGGYTMHSLTQQLIQYDTETQLRKGTQVEVLDTFCISRMRVGYVKEVIGHRVHVRYHGADIDGDDLSNSFWCHEQSDGINVVGWSKTVGHEILAPLNYNPPEIGNTSVVRKNPGINIQASSLNLATVSHFTLEIRIIGRSSYFCTKGYYTVGYP